jgi:heme-degrading monooxygenase HmoA
MFARITTADTRPEWVDDFINVYEKSIVPAAKSQKGFHKAYFLVDRKTGKGLSITIWDSEEDAIANEKNLYYQQQLVKVKNLFTSPPTRQGFEVAIEA